MNRRALVAVAVLLGWGAGVAVLLARELNPSPASRLADAALRVVPVTTYFAAERNGRHIGFASVEIDTVPRTLQVTEYLVAEEGNGGAPPARLTDQTIVRLSRGLALRDFAYLREAPGDTTRVDGRLADSTLVVDRHDGRHGPARPLALPAFPGAVALTVVLLLDDPRVGRDQAIPIVDPATGTAAIRRLRMAAESLFVVVDSAVADSSGRWFAVHRDTVRAWHLVSVDSGQAVDAWVDAQGLLVQQRRPDGLTLRRTAYELAFENWRLMNPRRAVSARAGGDVLAASWLAGGAPRPDIVYDTLRLKVGPSVPGGVARFLGSRGRPGAAWTQSRMPATRLVSRYSLPTTDVWRQTFASALRAEPAMQWDAPVIARRAVRLRGAEQDPLVVLQRIVRWVQDSLKADPDATPLTAQQAFERRAGDAREFALVTSALARAAGLPARVVSGLLYHEGRFYTHAWSYVYIGRWIPVDAMLGQVPVDAAHLDFLYDAVDAGPELTRLLGRLQLEVIGVVRAAPRPPFPSQ